jgi:hypothetical protein
MQEIFLLKNTSKHNRMFLTSLLNEYGDEKNGNFFNNNFKHMCLHDQNIHLCEHFNP